MATNEALEQYNLAQKAGLRQVKERLAAGLAPHPEVLDELLPPHLADDWQDLGVVEIPAERIAGTKTAGRMGALSAEFLPLLDSSTEFAAKWMNLCDAHLSQEGIREPVVCYEYLGHFYIQEGNKRVSVLRSFGATYITAAVRRILPAEDGSERVQAYHEFLDFYRDTDCYSILFTQPGQYPKLMSFLGKEPGVAWNRWEQRTFRAWFQYFKDAYLALGGDRLSLSPEEALLEWLEVYHFQDLRHFSDARLRDSLRQLWTDLEAISEDAPVQVTLEPGSHRGLWNRLLFSAPEHLQVAFVYQMDPDSSPFIRGHDLGRQHLEQVFGSKVTVKVYPNANSQEEAEAILDRAVAEGAQLVFTATPRLTRATRKAAMEYPKVHFFNCAVHVPYASMRTYYCRIFEAKFITGAIAGAMADNDRIGYIASHPIYGVPASINAFALGAQMTNPRARVQLRWSCLPGDPVGELTRAGCQVISNRDVPTSEQRYLQFGEYGTYFVEPDGLLVPLASPCWLWGKLYEQIVASVFNGTLEPGSQAMNYWWGMDSGVIDVELSPRLPESMRYLTDALRRGISSGSLDLFRRRILDQAGNLRNDGSRGFDPETLLTMDWLCENVDGCIPEFEDVLPFAQPMIRELGLHKEKIPPEKEEQSAL